MGQTFDLKAPISDPPIRPMARSAPKTDLGLQEGFTLTAYKSELDIFRSMVASFGDLDPAEVLGRISGIAGRIAEIRADLMRVNTPRCARLRTSEVDPLREDLDFQFRVWSRKIALMEWELRVSGGGI